MCRLLIESLQHKKAQEEHERIALGECSGYEQRRSFARTHPNDVLSLCQDWTFPFGFPIIYQRTQDTDKLPKFYLNYWVSINHSDYSRTAHGGVDFNFMMFGNGKVCCCAVLYHTALPLDIAFLSHLTACFCLTLHSH
jgi:hypothetical protein